MKQFLTSKKGITLLALFITLLLGITIGTIISDGVLSAQEETPVELLQIQGEGSPLLLGESASLTEGFARVANTVEPAVVNISTTAIIRTSGGQEIRRRIVIALAMGDGQVDAFTEIGLVEVIGGILRFQALG